MINISGLSINTIDRIKMECGKSIIESYWNEANSEGVFHVRLSDYAIVKCYGFDRSILITLGSKMCMLDKSEFFALEFE